MEVDPRFSSRVEDRDGQKALRFFAVEELSIRENETALLAASLGELCDLAGVDGEARSRFANAKGRTLYSNGWQSWCFAGELAEGERIHRARIVPNIAVYCDAPGSPEARGEVLSQFLTFVRSGESRLALVSRGSPDRATPPVAFRWDRASLDLRVDIYAKGARFAAGELVAELRLFYKEGYFAAKDALREAFLEYGHFDRLGFLAETAGGADGSGGLRPGGYESWYNHYTKIDEGIISGDLASIGANDNLINAYYLGRGKPTVFQIDDGWEKAVGQWEPDERKFPRGMKVLAEEIEGRGMVPGIWIAPLLATRHSAVFRDRPEWLLRDTAGRPIPAGYNPGWDGVFYCLDISLPEVEDYLAGVFDTIVEDWGYRYLKLDFLYAGFLGSTPAGPVKPAKRAKPTEPASRKRPGAAFQHYDRLMRRLTSKTKDSRGRAIAYLGCGAPLESSFRHFPLMRIGADTKEHWEDRPLKYVVWHQGRPAAYTNATHSIGRSLLDGTVFVNDPDVVFCRTSRMGLSETEKELSALVGFMLASQIMFSDDTREFGEEGERAFTARIIALYDRIGRREFAAERSARDVYALASRDGAIRGIANLSDSGWKGPGFDLARALVAHVEPVRGGGLVYEPHSISLYETG
jgi:alpha-galactosidase